MQSSILVGSNPCLSQLYIGGMKFGSVSSDPNDLTYVAPGALSNISQIEYDYSDYYEDYEEVEDGEESTKKRRAVQVCTGCYKYGQIYIGYAILLKL